MTPERIRELAEWCRETAAGCPNPSRVRAMRDECAVALDELVRVREAARDALAALRGVRDGVVFQFGAGGIIDQLEAALKESSDDGVAQ